MCQDKRSEALDNLQASKKDVQNRFKEQFGDVEREYVRSTSEIRSTLDEKLKGSSLSDVIIEERR